MAQLSSSTVYGDLLVTADGKINKNLLVGGYGRFYGSLGTAQSELGVYIGVSSANDPQIQLQGAGEGGPHIDFCNGTEDYDVRLILNGDDRLDVQGGRLHPLAGFDVDGTANFNGVTKVSNNTDYPLIIEGGGVDRGKVGIQFSGQSSKLQLGHFWADHRDGNSGPGGKYSFHFGSTEAVTNVVLESANAASNFYVGTNEVWHAGNDGPGSGLNADTVDGIQGASLLRSDASDTYTGVLSIAAGSSIKFLSGSYIRSYNDKHILHDHGNGHVTLSATSSSGSLYLGYNSGTDYQTGRIRIEADVYAATNTKIQLGKDGKVYDTGSRVYSANNTNIGSSSTQYAAGSHNHDSVYVKSSEFSTAQTFAGIAGKYLNKVSTSGVLEVGRYIDFHTTDSTADYDIRFDCASANIMSVIGGDIRCGGNITAFYTSDERLKSNITPITNPIEKVKALRTVEYVKHVKTTDEHVKETGFIAQDVRDVLPEIVRENEEGDLTIQTGGHELLALAVSAIKEQQKQIDKLTQEVAQLKK